MVIWPRVAGVLLVGYLCGKKPFAYLGIPPLFIGEIALAAFLLLKPRVALGTWAAALLRPSPLNGLGLAMLVFVAYGVWEAGRGVLAGSPVIYTLKFFVFNYYALYLFLGLWVALHEPECLAKLIRVTAWVNGIYGLIYILVLRHLGLHMPGATGVAMFVAPGGGAFAILGLLCFERDLRAVWVVVVVVLNIVVTVTWQVRAEWLGLALGILAWAMLTGRFGRVAGFGMVGLAVFGMLELADIKLVGRTGSVSLSETLARFIAPIDLQLAKEFSPHAAHHVGTAEWRERWWHAIWVSAHSTPMLEAFGHGYGFDLFGLAPEDVRAGQEDWEVRTPHSVFYYALGYTGWVGVGLFGVLQFAILRLLWRSYRVSGQPAGLVFWVIGMAMAFFEASFETPFEAIPFYLLAGMTIAPGLQWPTTSAIRSAPAQPYSLPADAGRYFAAERPNA